MSQSPSSQPAAAGGLRERNKREKLIRIRRAARQLFERKGFEGATAREICRRAGIGTGTLFLYVRDKRELLFLVFRDEARRLYREAASRVEDEMSLPVAMMCFFSAFIEFYARNPELSRVIAQELFFREHEPETMGALTLEFAGELAKLVEQEQRRARLRADVDTSTVVSACFAHYTFWVQCWLGAKMVSREEAERSLRQALELQLEGLSARGMRC